jgi:hypothetical protein
MKARLWFKRKKCAHYLIDEKKCSLYEDIPLDCPNCADFFKKRKPQDKYPLRDRNMHVICCSLNELEYPDREFYRFDGPFTKRFAIWKYLRESYVLDDKEKHMLIQSRKHPTRFYRYKQKQWEILDFGKGILKWTRMPSQFHYNSTEGDPHWVDEIVKNI